MPTVIPRRGFSHHHALGTIHMALHRSTQKRPRHALHAYGLHGKRLFRPDCALRKTSPQRKSCRSGQGREIDKYRVRRSAVTKMTGYRRRWRYELCCWVINWWPAAMSPPAPAPVRRSMMFESAESQVILGRNGPRKIKGTLPVRHHAPSCVITRKPLWCGQVASASK